MTHKRLVLLSILLINSFLIDAQPNYGKPTPSIEGWFIGEYIGDYSEYTSKERKMIDKGYMFWGNVALAKNAKGKYGLVDANERWTVPPKYDGIFIMLEYSHFKVKMGRYYGIIEKDGTEVLPIKYEDISVTAEGPDQEIVVKLNGKWGAMDKWGKKMTRPFLYESMEWLTENEEATSMMAKFNGKWGMVAEWGGKPLIPFIYDTIYADEETEGRVVAVLKDDKLLFDSKGRPKAAVSKTPEKVDPPKPVTKQPDPVPERTVEKEKEPDPKPQASDPVKFEALKRNAKRDAAMEAKLLGLWELVEGNPGDGWKPYNRADYDGEGRYFRYRNDMKVQDIEGIGVDEGDWIYDANTRMLHMRFSAVSKDEEFLESFSIRILSDGRLEMSSDDDQGGFLGRFKKLPFVFIPQPSDLTDLINTLSLSATDIRSFLKNNGHAVTKSETKGTLLIQDFGEEDRFQKIVTFRGEDVCSYYTMIRVETYKLLLQEMKRQGYKEVRPAPSGSDKYFTNGRFGLVFYNNAINGEEYLWGINPIMVNLVDLNVIKLD